MKKNHAIRFMASLLTLAFVSAVTLPATSALAADTPGTDEQFADRHCSSLRSYPAHFAECRAQCLEHRRTQREKKDDPARDRLIVTSLVATGIAGLVGLAASAAYALSKVGAGLVVPTRQMKQMSGQPVPEASREKTDTDSRSAKALAPAGQSGDEAAPRASSPEAVSIQPAG